MHSRRNSAFSPDHRDLPHWIFDVDDDDDSLDMRHNASLLQELEIDLEQIYTCILWMFIAPVRYLFARPNAGAHPIHRATNIDFWGPCLCVTIYGSVLWFCNVRDVPWIYAIWTVGSTFNHLTSRVWFNSSSLMLHLAITGYAICPIIPLSLLIVITHPPVWLANALEFLALVWAAAAAYLSYCLVCRGGNGQGIRPRVPLLAAPIALTVLYWLSMLPVREWQFASS